MNLPEVVMSSALWLFLAGSQPMHKTLDDESSGAESTVATQAADSKADSKATTATAAECVGDACPTDANRLTESDVKRVLAQSVHQASALGQTATIAVSDRVGNILAVFRMAGQLQDVTLSMDEPGAISGGLEGVILPGHLGGDALAAMTKAITGAYLSSEGNAFTTRTAGQIVQEHFNPGEQNQPAGPLFGVQFSQLACSDFALGGAELGPGPRRSPLGLAADPGGLPLYKNGVLVGGIGAIADGSYSLDRNIMDFDSDVDELIALAGTVGFDTPRDIRADRITVEGKTFRYADADLRDLKADPTQAPAFDSLSGTLLPVTGYTDGTIRAGKAFGYAESGITPAIGFDSSLDAFMFVDEMGSNRFAPRAGTDDDLLGGVALTAEEVKAVLESAVGVANRARAQIRKPLGSQARVTVSVVDSRGQILGILRTRDAPVFGADVSLQKARTAAFFSGVDSGEYLQGISSPAQYLNPDLTPADQVFIGDYVDAARSFVGSTALRDGTAFSDRAGGNLSRPFYPDGIKKNNHGPFSKPYPSEWSVFSTGMQLDLIYNQVINHLLFVAGASSEDVGPNCVQSEEPRIANGIQIFPGSVPIYRGGTLVGGIGVSGDGIDQDDMISFLGVHNAGLAMGGSIGNAPREIRADNLTPQGVRLRYIQCPFAPFLNENSERVCDGL